MRPYKTRARYGTGDFLKLNKRECGISIELIPSGADFLEVVWHIDDDSHMFWASSAMGDQFNSFVEAVYKLYAEGTDSHESNRRASHRAKFFYSEEDDSLRKGEVKVQTHVNWNGERYSWTGITFSRKFDDGKVSKGEDIVEIIICTTETQKYTYFVDGRDLCYAIAKAYTETIKKYGFYGYYATTGGDCNGIGDAIDIHMLLFIKAYALGAMEVRELEVAWKDTNSRWKRARRTSFEKEMELFLFDM